MTPKFDCVKPFMDTDAFCGFSAKYGLDSEIVASFYESFATHIDLPKEKLFKYQPPIKEEIKELVPVKEETILYNVDPVVPSAYIEKPPFSVRIKEHAKVSNVVNKSYIRTPKPDEQIKVEPSIAMVKISWLIILMGMLFISVIKLLELLDPVLRNIDLL